MTLQKALVLLISPSISMSMVLSDPICVAIAQVRKQNLEKLKDLIKLTQDVHQDPRSSVSWSRDDQTPFTGVTL